MPVVIQNTRDVSSGGIKGLVYGPSGIGKTVLCSTASENLIVSAERGLLSIRFMEVDFTEITCVADLDALYDEVINVGLPYSTLCLDSISDIAEAILLEQKTLYKDARQAYGEMADQVERIVRKFRDIDGINVIMTAKQRRIISDTGVSSYVPAAPGQVLPAALPYLFDLVMPLRIGTLEDGTKFRYLQTQPDFEYEAKDRSGILAPAEEPNLDNLFSKILEYEPVYEEEGE